MALSVSSGGAVARRDTSAHRLRPRPDRSRCRGGARPVLLAVTAPMICEHLAVVQDDQPHGDQPGVDPLLAYESIALLPSTGETEFTFLDGRVQRFKGGPLSPSRSIVKSTFFPARSQVGLLMLDGTTLFFEVGTILTAVDRPVVYLDQNYWIDLARVRTGTTSQLTCVRRELCEEVIALARAGEVILPLSSGHAVETAKASGQRRSNLARTQLELSHGWQMRSPLLVRRRELLQLFSTDRAAEQGTDTFTLLPQALWSDSNGPYPPPAATPTGPMDGLINRLSWVMAIAEVLLNEEREVSAEGADIAARWAASFQELAQYIPGNPKARARLRDLSRIRFITDMGTDVAKAASLAGLTPEEFSEWLSGQAESDFHRAPALGRIREVLHLRLRNSDDTWEANDLNDLLYLATAAGYADVVVCERKTANYLNQVVAQVPAGAAVFRRLEDAIELIRSLTNPPAQRDLEPPSRHA